MSYSLPSTTPIVNGISELADDYDGFVLDTAGVLHDGSAVYPGALDALRQLKSRGKKVCLLTNQARRTSSSARLLAEMGLEPDLYDHLLTSGELAHQWLRHRPDEWLQELGTACLHFGPIRDAELIHGLDMEAVDQPYLAQFVLCTGFNEVEDVLADYEEVFRICVAKDLPLLCADPERWRLVNGERCPGAGAMARRYADLGGDVEYCGLPFGEMYARCFDLLGVTDRSRILAVGDNLTTDIAAAGAAGIDSVLVTGGIHREDFQTVWGEAPQPERLESFLAAATTRPRAALATFVW
ncbi:MAG TPA: TIGR01459 family HAD-type hydrolase [Skermanella sp.]|jgi:HAD superfamily hydrolase (TIGR01459 family)|nr:TIGR01459 family HAD-type hydrolase [Skermanella sp.]